MSLPSCRSRRHDSLLGHRRHEVVSDSYWCPWAPRIRSLLGGGRRASSSQRARNPSSDSPNDLLEPAKATAVLPFLATLLLAARGPTSRASTRTAAAAAAGADVLA